MKYDKLEIVGLPKSFKIYKAVNYLYEDGEPLNPEDVIYDEYPAECDFEHGEQANYVFKYDDSSTGVYAEYKQHIGSLSLWLSPWASEVDVLLYAAFINSILKKHPRAKLYDKYELFKAIDQKQIERMISDRKKYLKRMLTTKEGFTMEGLNHDFTLKVEYLRPAPSIDIQVEELQTMFTGMQWDFSDEE